MKRYLLLVTLFCFVNFSLQAQYTRYVVQLKNKGNSTFSLGNPIAFLSQKAIDRRTKYNIPIDSTDLPVSLSYFNQIKNVPNVTVLNSSKWLNSITILTTDATALSTINGFSFVQSANGIAARTSNAGKVDQEKWQETIYPIDDAAAKTTGTLDDYYNYGTTSYDEIHLHNGEFLHNIGMRGNEMNIGILDGGFYQYKTLKAFDSVNAENRVIDTWDFVSREPSVNEDHPHGMQCFSTIAANIPGQFTGKAPKAKFYLYRTEDADPNSENLIEEHNWVCGAERADSAGVSIISTSLGYTDFPQSPALSHTYADMNGNTTIASRGADLAAKKGILVFAAIGNDGSGIWHYLSTPSDGDSVVAVGAVNKSGIIGSFSSYGPSSDGRIKPDMASVGVAALVQTTGNSIGYANGTSFACPNMAGLGACLWQGFPEFNNIKILKALQQSGNRFNTPDNRTGYGIPDVKKAFGQLLVEYSTATATLNSCIVTLTWNSKDESTMSYEIERRLPVDTVYKKIKVILPQQGNILANHSYSLNDSLNNVAAGMVSYRIRQIIDTLTASFTALYIDTVTVAIVNPCITETINVRVQPNPVTSATATIIVESPFAIASMPVSVFDNAGRLLINLSLSKQVGKQTIDLPVGRLPTGKYYVRVFNGATLLGTASFIRL